ncbi:MAG: nickel ABC transporter ATP-binding protein [Candidatus Omnitrophica bacterium CG1_02_44_16]|nr:MAG: nickel ABC transporter ATP-binding protein [Candidatus Omnitrophica bacterium CG1_02_44_16]PIY82467.1 MAG: nickel ABC transporter ATP-binding protein [Candidatus Omnitrophica bacterium CG_4_10_14_0_8_um_filter_44_12]PIZ84138.1 MAG: nickel ABC transporter ATP-binding protein [Candidatus Omnitrophica bacterium CG_4_10_14_0_2_um_filter_44_9]
MDDIIFELKDVNFSYLGKYPALWDINITIKRGEKISVIGANGSGKSTLLHMLDGLIFPDKGIIRAFGKELREGDLNDAGFSRNFRKSVGLVFQNPDIQLFCPTVREDIIFGPLQLGASKIEIEKCLEELTAMLGITDLLDRSPHQLSIGERRKVAIATTLIIGPDVLLLDEPTAGLDPLTTRHIIDLLNLASSSGKTIITSTHDLHIVEEISDTVYVFGSDKKIAAFGSSSEILKDERLLMEHNLVHIHAHRHKDIVHVHPHQHTDHH